MAPFNPIHQHLLIRATIHNHITDPDVAKLLLINLVKEIGMSPVTPPQSTYVSDDGNEGLTGSINLATSHIAYHIWDKRNLFMGDVYSCKLFDTFKAVNFINDNFGELSDVRLTQIDRETGKLIDFFIVKKWRA